jgi:hypothetical protein
LLASFKFVSSGVLGDLLAVRPFASRFLHEGKTMKIRKIAVLGSLAAGAALAFAPLASADDLSSILSGEESILNSMFVTDADLAGVSSSDYSNVDGFDVINAADIAKDAPATAPFSTLDYELFGVNPALAGVASDPGSYNVLNGALTEFSDAYNVEYAALLNGGALDTNVADYIGSAHEISTALGTDSVTGAFTTFLDAALGDLAGFAGY